MNRFIQKSRKKEITELIRYQKYAITYYEKGEYDKSLNYYKNALSISEKVLGTEHLDTATLYNNIAGAYYALGNHAQALEYYKKALSTREEALGPEHPDTATLYNNIAGVYFAKADYVQVLKYYEKALSIGRHCPHLLKNLGNYTPILRLS